MVYSHDSDAVEKKQQRGGTTGYANGYNGNQEGGVKRQRNQRGGFILVLPLAGRLLLKQIGLGTRKSQRLQQKRGGAANAIMRMIDNRHRASSSSSSSSFTSTNKKKTAATRKVVPSLHNTTGNARSLFQSVNPRVRNKSLHRLISGWRLHGPNRGQERPGYNPRLKRFFALLAEKMHANRTGYMKLMKEGPLDVNVEYSHILKCLRHK